MRPIVMISPWTPSRSGVAAFAEEAVEFLRKAHPDQAVFIISHTGAVGKFVRPIIDLSKENWYEPVIEAVRGLDPEVIHIQHEYSLYNYRNSEGKEDGNRGFLKLLELLEDYPCIVEAHTQPGQIRQLEGERELAAKCSRLIFHSHHQEWRLGWNFKEQGWKIPENITIIPKGIRPDLRWGMDQIDPLKRELGLEKYIGKHVIGLIGWSKSNKEWDTLTNVWEEIYDEILAKTGTKWSLLFIPAGEIYHKVMAISDFLILPSLDETQSGALSRIIAMNKPFLSTPPMEGSISSMLESEGGLLFSSQAMLKKQVIKLAVDGRLRFELGANLKRYLDEVVSWEIVAGQYREVYDQAISQTRIFLEEKRKRVKAEQVRLAKRANIKRNKKVIEEVLSAYPEKTRKKRAKHMMANESSCPTCPVKSNVKSIPGVMTARGCAFAGSKGVVWGPISDMVHISHGPVGCGHYSWGTRRNLANGKPGVDNFMPFHFTSDFQEKDIVFGGDKKLEGLIREVHELFPNAKGISIQSECPVGLIGDDIEAVAKKMSEELGIYVIPVRCEGFRGVSQSLGHHIANDAIRDNVLGTRKLEKTTPYDVALIGDYNIGGDMWASKKILEEIGLRIIATWTGDGKVEEMALTTQSKLNLIHCYRSMNYIARHMEDKYSIPWMEYNFFGPTKIAASLRKIAGFFDRNIQDKAEAVIAKYEPEMQKVIDTYLPRLKKKTVMLYVGGLRPRHVIGAYEDLGMEIIGAGYEFGHKDDYERTFEKLKDGVLIYDDVTEFEMESFVKKLKPDLVGSGIKEKYVYQKMGTPFRQMHSWDYSGPYHGYEGFPIFARDMDMAINSPTWGLVEAPWKAEKKLEKAA